MRVFRFGPLLSPLSTRFRGVRSIFSSYSAYQAGTKMTLTGTDSKYQPHLLSVVPGSVQGLEISNEDWTASLDLQRTIDTAQTSLGSTSLRVLVLYGSLRERSVHMS